MSKCRFGASGWLALIAFSGIACNPRSFNLTGETQAANTGASYFIQIKPGGDTDLKRIAVPSSELTRGEEACGLPAGAKILLTQPPIRLSNGHYLINRTEIPRGCSFSSGFVYAEHVASTSRPLITESSGGGFKLKPKRDLYFKRGTGQSGPMDKGSEKCTLYGNASYDLQGPPILFGDHYVINLARRIEGCSFTLGLAYKEYVKVEDPNLGLDVSQRTRRFLDLIAWTEGTGPHYNRRFGGFTFQGYGDHPRIQYCDGVCSDASGRYQFMSYTWDDVSGALGLNDFSPENQDRAALYLIHGRGVSNIEGIDTYQDFANAVYKLRNEWCSFPGCDWDQNPCRLELMWQWYNAATPNYGASCGRL